MPEALTQGALSCLVCLIPIQLYDQQAGASLLREEAAQ